jgi:hypothetical protein
LMDFSVLLAAIGAPRCTIVSMTSTTSRLLISWMLLPAQILPSSRRSNRAISLPDLFCDRRCSKVESSLPAILLHITFWRMDLRYFGRGLLGSWPQVDAGVVLWSLSVCGNDWQTSEKLTRLCTIPEPATLTGTWDRSAFAMEAKILRPLLWFGLLEYRSEKSPDSRFAARHYYRKTALFDRLLTFDVKMDFAESRRH